MPSLQDQFKAAQDDLKSLDTRPSNTQLLRIYALFKQATEGDVQGERPGFADMVARAKYDAWAQLKGMTPEAAMQAYIEMAEELS